MKVMVMVMVMGLFHFVYGASPQQILLHLHIILLHLPIKFASHPQKLLHKSNNLLNIPDRLLHLWGGKMTNKLKTLN